MPTSARVAVIALGVLAALLLLNAALLGFGFDAAVDRILEENDDASREQAETFVLFSLVPYLVLGVFVAVSAGVLPLRRSWARWVGVAATALLTLLGLSSVLAAGGVTIASLLLLVLSVAALTSLLARTTKQWTAAPVA
jgi:hypothetical protein